MKEWGEKKRKKRKKEEEEERRGQSYALTSSLDQRSAGREEPIPA